MQEENLCYNCEVDPDPERSEESSGYCPVTCDACGACVGCDWSC